MANDPARNAAYGAAARRLREEHPTEWRKFLQEETESRGLEYKPRLSPIQAAERTISDLLEQFPELQTQYGG